MDPTVLSIEDLEGILQTLKDDHSRTCVIDWDNNVVRVLSARKVNPRVIMSDGRGLEYRDLVLERRY